MAAAGREPIEIMALAAEMAPELDRFVDDESKPGSARAWIDWILRVVETGKVPMKVSCSASAANVLRRREGEI